MLLDDVWVTTGEDYTLEFGDRLLGQGYQGNTQYLWWLDVNGEWVIHVSFH